MLAIGFAAQAAPITPEPPIPPGQRVDLPPGFPDQQAFCQARYQAAVAACPRIETVVGGRRISYPEPGCVSAATMQYSICKRSGTL
jgi:hypothetical protein